MFRKGPAVALSALMLMMGACGPGVRAQGSAAIAGFLRLAQADDAKAFEAGIDRPALRSDLRAQLAELGKTHGVDIDGGASEFALDRMITPQAVRQAAARVAPAWPAAPLPAQVVPHMKVLDRRHICLEEATSHGCLLSFAQADSAWRLVGMAFTPPRAEP